MINLDDVMSDIHTYIMSDVDSAEGRRERDRLIGAIMLAYDESATAATERFNALVAHVRSLPLGSFGIMPPLLAARALGWGDDEDRDSTRAARLAVLVRDMDESVAAWLADPYASVEEAERIMGLWQAIRKITQSREE